MNECIECLLEFWGTRYFLVFPTIFFFLAFYWKWNKEDILLLHICKRFCRTRNHIWILYLLVHNGGTRYFSLAVLNIMQNRDNIFLLFHAILLTGP